MDFLTDWLTNWLKELLIGGIMGNLEGLFDTVNTQVGEIAAQVGTTPAAWHAGVFSLIRQLSETVILPIAGMVLTFVATYELIQMLLEKNNMHEVDVANLYKWMFKTACAILILSNTFNIVMAVFDVSQSVIAQAGGLIQGSTDVSADMLAELETSLEAMDLGPLLGLWLQSALIGFTMKAMGIIIFVLVYGRMLEIYLLTSLAPIPVATLSNRELGGTGQNYIKSLFAVGFQGLLILVCVAIYAVLIQGIATSGDPIGAIWGTVGYTVLLCFMLFKTGSMDKNQGYAILKAVMLENGRGFALGEHPTAPSRYVTWACYDDKDGQRQYEWGHYGNDRTAMEQDFTDRVQDYQRIYNVGIRQTEAPGLYKYYSTQRPVDIGTFPKPPYNKPDEIFNYDQRIPVENGSFLAWGYLTYTRPLTEKQASDYELRPAPDNPDRPRPIAEQMKNAAKLAEADRGSEAPAPQRRQPDRGDR